MNRVQVTVPNGQDTSNSIPIPEGEVLCAISCGAGFTGASLGYEVSYDNGLTWLTVFGVDSTTAHATNMSNTARFVPVNSAVFLASMRGYTGLIRVKTASAQSPAMPIFLHFREVR